MKKNKNKKIYMFKKTWAKPGISWFSSSSSKCSKKPEVCRWLMAIKRLSATKHRNLGGYFSVFKGSALFGLDFGGWFYHVLSTKSQSATWLPWLSRHLAPSKRHAGKVLSLAHVCYVLSECIFMPILCSLLNLYFIYLFHLPPAPL